MTSKTSYFDRAIWKRSLRKTLLNRTPSRGQ